MEITVQATASVAGLKRGDVAVVTVTPFVEALINSQFLMWLDAPEPTFEDFQVTPEVEARNASIVLDVPDLDDKSLEADAFAAVLWDESDS